jgi:hypothetical protein
MRRKKNNCLLIPFWLRKVQIRNKSKRKKKKMTMMHGLMMTNMSPNKRKNKRKP